MHIACIENGGKNICKKKNTHTTETRESEREQQIKIVCVDMRCSNDFIICTQHNK